MTTYITIDCLAYFMYKQQGEEYGSPLIGSLFESDTQFVKFCQNYFEYIKMTPTFGEPKLPVKILDIKKPVVMFLGDIEIHWPHKSDEKEVLEKWNARVARINDMQTYFIWTDECMFNGYSEELKNEFLKIPGSRFFHVADIPGYVKGTLDYNAMSSFVLNQKSAELHFHD